METVTVQIKFTVSGPKSRSLLVFFSLLDALRWTTSNRTSVSFRQCNETCINAHQFRCHSRISISSAHMFLFSRTSRIFLLTLLFRNPEWYSPTRFRHHTTIDVQKAPGPAVMIPSDAWAAAAGSAAETYVTGWKAQPMKPNPFPIPLGHPVACSFLSTENNHSCIAENISHVAFATQTSRGKKLH